MSQKHLCEGWKREKLKPSTSHQQRRSMARRSCPRIGYSEADPKASCATWQAPPIEPASAACTYSNYILNLLSSNKSPSNLWHVYDVFGACTVFFSSGYSTSRSSRAGSVFGISSAVMAPPRKKQNRIILCWQHSFGPGMRVTPKNYSNLYRTMLINLDRILSSQCRAGCRMDSIRHSWNRGLVASLFKWWIISRNAVS